ncbi:hypothetical protein ACFQZF_06115 [Flavobacterium myungsuense]|uniref:Uncharacterized protein n=1 Tax=Flavobacterium myungsuense TaxID=651823 RepID=A0ABW3J335_9FLAO
MKTSWKIVLGIVGFLILLSVINNIKSCSAENEKEGNMTFKPALSSKEIKCSNPLINGELGNYLEIKDYKAIINFIGIEQNFSDNKYIQKWEVKVCIKRNNKPLPFEVKNLSGNSGINVQLLNSNSSPISNLDEINGFGISIDELLSLKTGENKWVTFSFEFGESQKEDIIKDINFFILNSKIDFVEKSTSTTIINSDEENIDADIKAAEKATEIMERQVEMMDKVNKMSKEK